MGSITLLNRVLSAYTLTLVFFWLRLVLACLVGGVYVLGTLRRAMGKATMLSPGERMGLLVLLVLLLSGA